MNLAVEKEKRVVYINFITTQDRTMIDEETYRLQLAGISTISICNTEKSLSQQMISEDSPYWTVALGDVETAAKREILLIKKVDKLKELLLLTDPVVSDVVVSDTQIKQHQEFLKYFPDEREKLGL